MKKLTAVMDPEFQEAHRKAFLNPPVLPTEGDVVFLWDHYWPGKVVKANTGDSHVLVATPSALDGTSVLNYFYRHLRPCPNFAVPTDEEAAALSETL